MAQDRVSKELSIFDQLTFMRAYTQILFCFPLSSNRDAPQVVELLRQAADALIKRIPYLGGQVINQKDDDLKVANTGTFRIAPYEHPNGSVVRIKYLDDFPSYTELKRAKAPASMLDGRILAPERGFPEHYDIFAVTPVWLIQANFIPGGLILCFSGMHNVMDATGLGQLIRRFAVLCTGEELSAEDVDAANFERALLPVALKPGQEAMNHKELRTKPSEANESAPVADSPSSKWAYFNIGAKELAELKAEGAPGLEPHGKWASTNDIITAWLWKFITLARSPRLSPLERTTLCRAINGRQVLNPGLPLGYVGNVVACSYLPMTISQLLHTTLPRIALEIRESTSKIDDHFFRSFAHLIRSEPDKRTIVFALPAPSQDFLISSWARLPVHTDFGALLRRPEFVRRPTSPPWESCCYVMPQNPDGSLDVLISLQEDDMKSLRTNGGFTAHADYIG